MRQFDFYEFTGVIAPGTVILLPRAKGSVLTSVRQIIEASTENGSPLRG